MKVRKLFTKAYWHRKYVNYLDKTNSEKLIWAKMEELFYVNTGKWLDWNHPKDINEKLMWLNRFAPNPLKTKCADKYLVREYVKKKGLEELLIPLLGVWDSADDIDFNSLPEQFALKCNNGCGYNIICSNKSSLDLEQTKKKLDDWLKTDYSLVLYEFQYRDIPRKIVGEEYIQEYEQDGIVDYKFHCINGKVHSCLVCYNRKKGLCLDAYSTNWERRDYVKQQFRGDRKLIDRPRQLEYMLQVSSILSEDFDYCRVDLYEIDGKVRFGEMTFTPAANIMSYYSQDFLDELGDCLQLPVKSKI